MQKSQNLASFLRGVCRKWESNDEEDSKQEQRRKPLVCGREDSKQIWSRQRHQILKWRRSVPSFSSSSALNTPREVTSEACTTKGECKSRELLKSGEVSSLIKQGFIDRTQWRLSPGRVSPLQDTTTASSSPFSAKTPLQRHNLTHNNPSSSDELRVSSPTTSVGAPSNKTVSFMSQTTPCRGMPMPTLLADISLGRTGCLPSIEKPRSNTLLHMLMSEPDVQQYIASPPHQGISQVPASCLRRSKSAHLPTGCALLGHPLFDNSDTSDVLLTLKSRASSSISLHLHRRYLVEHSKYFAALLSAASCKQHTLPYMLEIKDCDDLEIYQDTLRLLYFRELRSNLLQCNVARVLGILQVAVSIEFEACINCCLEYLEAVPWSEEEEEQVRSVLGRVQLDGFVASKVLQRLKREEVPSEETLVCLVQMVINGKDNKARKEMKAIVSKMLHENTSTEQNGDCVDLSKDSLYGSCAVCMKALLALCLQASAVDWVTHQCNDDRVALMAQVSLQADNLQWLLEILLDRHIADEFVKMWAHQTELATAHKGIPTLVRAEVSCLTARVCMAIGKGQVLCPVEVRHMLLQTWLHPLMNDFGWIQRCCKGMEKNSVEEGISQTILTLPLKLQQGILLEWFDRFALQGDECPNLQRAFEVWWRRTFVRRCK